MAALSPLPCLTLNRLCRKGERTGDLSQTILLGQLVAPVCVLPRCLWVLFLPQGHFVTSQLVLSESCRAMWSRKGHPHHRRQQTWIHFAPPTVLFSLFLQLLKMAKTIFLWFYWGFFLSVCRVFIFPHKRRDSRLRSEVDITVSRLQWHSSCLLQFLRPRPSETDIRLKDCTKCPQLPHYLLGCLCPHVELAHSASLL